MTNTSVNVISARVEDLVAAIAVQYSIHWPPEASDSLVDGGFTSMAIVELMLGIERGFDLVIPDRDLTPANFGRTEALVALVHRLSGLRELTIQDL